MIQLKLWEDEKETNKTELVDYTYKKVKTLKDLVVLFYALQSRDRPEYTHLFRQSMVADLKTAKFFVKRIMGELDIDRAEALLMCGELENTFFQTELPDTAYVKNYTVFGQGKMKWVTDALLKEVLDD